MGDNPLVEAKKRLISKLEKETDDMKENYEDLKQADEPKVKRYFAYQLQNFCIIVDQSKPVIETYFAHNAVPVSLIRALESYYATMKALLSEFPEVAMDPKLETAIGKVFLPYQKMLSKLKNVADLYIQQQKAKKG